MSAPKVFLSGIGGYATNYINAMLNPREDSLPFEFIAAADPYAEKCPLYPDLIKAGVKIYHDDKEFFAENTCDLCIVSSPIQFHLEQVALAMEKGAYVLSEKPIGATLEQALKMRELEIKYNRPIMIGFQWSYAEGMLALKRDIMAGRFGKPIEMRSMIDWPRGAKYYARPWAGKIHDESGRPVFDSIANNACAHYIHNMLFLLGDKIDESAMPQAISAQLYRANAIENFDTAFVKIKAGGADLLFAASHAGARNANPVIDYRFEKARITMTGATEDKFVIKVETDEGDILYPMNSTHQDKFYAALREMQGEAQPCTVNTAIPHMLCIDAISRMPISTIAPGEITRTEIGGDFFNVVTGMDVALEKAFETGMLPQVGDAEFVTETFSVPVAKA